jgi:hypothetical protein
MEGWDFKSKRGQVSAEVGSIISVLRRHGWQGVLLLGMSFDHFLVGCDIYAIDLVVTYVAVWRLRFATVVMPFSIHFLCRSPLAVY